MAPPAETEIAEPGLAAALLRSAALGAVLLAVALAVRQAAPGLLHDVRPSASGAALLVLGGGALTAVGAPRQAVAAAAGYGFGPALGVALALAAQMLGCAADVLAARTVARPWAERRAGPRWARFRAALRTHPFRMTLMLRLLPVGNNTLLNLAAGAAGLRGGAFFLATALGYVPQTLVFALLGAGVRLGRAEQLILAALLLVASAFLGVGLARRLRRDP